jgi:hypothetical protein
MPGPVWLLLAASLALSAAVTVMKCGSDSLSDRASALVHSGILVRICGLTSNKC